MIMKKYVQNFWVRFLAVLLCSVTVLTGTLAGVLLFGLVMLDSKEDLYENGQGNIAENYAAYIYDHIYEDNQESLEKDSEAIQKLLEYKNFTCSVGIIAGGDTGTEASEKEELIIYNNLENSDDWDYVFDITDGSYVTYELESPLRALAKRPIIQEQIHTVEAAITECVFEEATGLFYYKTKEQYFLVDYIEVCKDGVSYDYQLKKNEDGKKVYYNGYYNITLDTSEHEAWDWVKLNNGKFIVDDISASNAIRIITDDSIQNNLYTGVYYENNDNYSISYYPERVDDIYRIRIKINEDVTNMDNIYHDMFSDWKLITDAFYENEDSYQAVLIISIILFIMSFALLIYCAKDKKEEFGLWYKIPVAMYSLGFLGLVELGLCGLLILLVNDGLLHGAIPFDIGVTLCVLDVFAIAFVVFLWLQNIITRFKTKTFIRYSELHYSLQILKWCWAKWKWLWHKLFSPFRVILELARENTKLFTKGLVIMIVFSLIELIAIIICRWEWDNYLVLFFVAKIVEFPLVSFILLQMQKLQEGSKRIAAGDLSEPIDTSKMFWEFKRHGENINKVSDGIALAVEDRMKSERFKTELITNVSHDIKTPLTSIINYVDLIKKEEIQDETLQEYIDVLDRQSARLKKLIEDLMEASKASTGNLAVNLEECDVEVLLTQIIGEFEDKLIENQLEVVVQKPEHPVIVSADGRHLWRVLDNLLNNACKYSLSGTRVYISLVQLGNEAVITFKNISKVALNIPSEELMERFVRGDSSRNTEGSGLGLSIAQSLTELMNGSMQLDIDGDLFKVTLRFQATSK